MTDQAPDIFYDIALRRLDEHLHRVDSLDAKGATVFFSAVLAVVAAVVQSSSKTIPRVA